MKINTILFVFLLSLFSVCIVFGTNDEDDSIAREEFTNWMQTHSKQYTNSQFNHRFKIFKDNLNFINNWNGSHEVGLNQFSDLTTEEFASTYLGALWNDNGTDDSAEYLQQVERTHDTVLPTYVNWTASGYVSPIRNQLQCGSCWSFSSIASIESAHALATGRLVSLSEQNLIDCTVGLGGNEGCDGGFVNVAFKYVIANNGVDLLSAYPYKAHTRAKCSFLSNKVGATISSFRKVAPDNQTALEIAVAQQPVTVSFDASHQSFQLYKSGLYIEPKCQSAANELDHSVVVTGYGSTTADGQFWILRNSLGIHWGMEGYFLLPRNGKNNCGVLTSSSYPVI